jgi:succinate dehydrogenase / fumarate reductase flavoprotein subunit
LRETDVIIHSAFTNEVNVILDGKIPAGPIHEKWDRRRAELKLVNPANKRKYRIIVIGTGLAGASAAASLGELGYHVDAFFFQDSPRRAHSISAQGGINAASNYANDNDSVERLFYDTIKGGDFRSREANVYRLAQLSCNIIDQAVAQGVPFARDYAGYLATRSFGGAQVSRTFYARGQTGQQLLLGAYGALLRQVKLGTVTLHPRTEMLDLVLVQGEAKGITFRDLLTGAIESHAADAVCLCSGGYANVFFLSTNSINSSVNAIFRAYRRGAFFANPCYTQIHPTCIPVTGDHQAKLTLMSESLRNDGRVWVPARKGDTRPPGQIPEGERDYFLERKFPSFGNLAARDVSSRAAKEVCDEGRGVGPGGRGVYLDFGDAIRRQGVGTITERYGNLFEMYERITAENAYQQPMRIYPAPHYTMGGLWVDYNLESNIRGLFVLGEANFSDHGANRLGASGLMQGLADGYFILPCTIANYLAGTKPGSAATDLPEFRQSREDVTSFTKKLLSVKGRKTPAEFHRELGRLMWDHVGMARNEQSLKTALRRIPEIREEFWKNLLVAGGGMDLNRELERAGRVADFLDFAELLARDALVRDESCGAHFRMEHQTPDGEADRNDKDFCNVSAWQYTGDGKEPELHKEPLTFEHAHLAMRSYK